jgi:DoxX-like family
VDQTATFFVLTASVAVAISGWALSNRSVLLSEKVARGFYIVSVALSLAAFLLIVAGTAGVPEGATYVRLLRLLLYRFWIVISVGVSAAVLVVLFSASGWKQPGADALRAFVSSRYVLGGLCFSVSISFLCTEIGKLSHDADMRQFFLQSGYTIGFMYLIMAAETAGAIGLLLPRTTLPAALGLMAIMMGAIRTHAHNRDPFSDSLEAVHLLVLLACIVVLSLMRSKAATNSQPVANC